MTPPERFSLIVVAAMLADHDVPVAGERVEVGDFVFVDPDEERAPLLLRRHSGTLVGVEGGTAVVRRQDGLQAEVPVELLRRERRRKR